MMFKNQNVRISSNHFFAKQKFTCGCLRWAKRRKFLWLTTSKHKIFAENKKYLKSKYTNHEFANVLEFLKS